MVFIDSKENEHYKVWRSLRTRKYRERFGDYILEGEKTVREAKEVTIGDTLIALPKPYTVPCIDRHFQELYYWDTYFTNRGLLLSGRVDLAINNIENIAYLIDKYGFIPNNELKDVAKKFDEMDSFRVNPDDLIEFTRGIQEGSAIDSNARVEAWDMPGYSDKVVMASGSFTQGSSIELSCDGPIREPYIAYMQGSLTYPYGKLGLMKAVQKIMKGGI